VRGAWRTSRRSISPMPDLGSDRHEDALPRNDVMRIGCQ